jgi:hypothetical protein
MSTLAVQSSYEPGANVTLRAVLTEGGLPVERRATVMAELGRPDGTSTTAALAELEPGVFESSFTAAVMGIYPVRFRAYGTTLRGHAFTREQLRTAAVWRGGDAPPPTGQAEPPRTHEPWCRLLECLLKANGIEKTLEKAGIDANDVRRCLKEACG